MEKRVNKNRPSGGVKKRGRPAGSRTRYPGIERFAAWYGCSHQFARKVLDGEAASAPLRDAWGEWQARGMGGARRATADA